MNANIRQHADLPPSRFGRAESGFTMVELMVTITIIAIIAGATLAAMQKARTYAAEQKTKGTIAKLDAIIMKKWESYKSRRVPITIPPGTQPKVVAKEKLNALRDLMRMEMPERWEDVFYDPVTDQKSPALREIYQAKRRASKTFLVGTKGMNTAKADELINNIGGAECLYQIVSIGNPADMQQFSTNEIADTDGDGLSEFVDGWGRPIFFLRWAAGYNTSDVQRNIDFGWTTGLAPGQRSAATNEDHDPFDPRKVDTATYDTEAQINPPLATGWRLIPLIYSAGPDGKYGLCDVSEFRYGGNPYVSIKEPDTKINRGMGAPRNNGESFDNITNHRIEMN